MYQNLKIPKRHCCVRIMLISK